MQKGIIGKKIGMTQIFNDKGQVVPVTVVEAGPCVVSQLKTVETTATPRCRSATATQSPQGHKAHGRPLQRGDVAPKRTLREFR